MAGTTAEAQVAKKCYKNQTAGWQSVVKLDHLGAQRGTPVEPYGTTWLTDDEAILTARAPALAKDNPFVPQMFQFYDEHNNIVEQEMAPIVLIEPGQEDSATEADRFVPGQESTVHEVNLDDAAAAQRDAQAVLDAPSDRPVPTAPVPATLAPSSTAAVPPSHAKAAGLPDDTVPAEPEEDQRESWVDPAPDRTVEPQQGSLSGSNEKVGPVEGDGGSETHAPPQQPIQQQVAQSSVEAHDGQHGEPNASESSGTGKANGGAIEQGPGARAAQAEQDAESPRAGEETAAHTESGEETAAEIPAQDKPEGEFAATEEVGSPDAATQDEASA